jgi:hypothetical protein
MFIRNVGSYLTIQCHRTQLHNLNTCHSENHKPHILRLYHRVSAGFCGHNDQISGSIKCRLLVFRKELVAELHDPRCCGTVTN